MIEAMSAGMKGIETGMLRFHRAAGSLVRDLDPGAAIDSKLARTQVEASVAVVRAADETVGKLIDELA